MLKKVLEYAGDYRKKTYQAIATMLIGVGMNILPFLFIYQIITPLIMHQEISSQLSIYDSLLEMKQHVLDMERGMRELEEEMKQF